ncbi:MAG TPA: enoyl-CoA hydratase/isomerase family protein [Acidimicrobiia bacterium]|nr:enoyl-CoA hydratase/isomerase family protein [Acidimicrobiia bacterium]
MTAYETLELQRDGDIAWLRLNRPDKLNSFTVKMWREMRALGNEMHDDPSIRCMVVIGNGRAFSSGIDTSVFTGAGADDAIQGGDDAGTRHVDPTVDGILRTQEAYSWLSDARYPTIAAVRGYAFGAGLQLAIACDIRVFARGAQVGLLEHKYGILPDLGGTQRLPRIVGAGKAKELIWTTARIDADEAFRIGLCERLVDEGDLEKEVEVLASTIASAPPLAVQGAKRAIEAAGRLPVAEGLVVEAEEQARCLHSNDMREAITAFVEQRAPEYNAQ